VTERTQPAWWALLPLRLFLGVTFAFAGLQKLADPAYHDGSSPTSVQAMIRSLQGDSPIGFLLGWSGHAPVLVGVLIAVGELAVGLATLAGLWVRLTAAGGFLLALTFFLTVSWRTRPYYYGSDIVFMAAWSIPLLAGRWGGPTLDALIAGRAAPDADPQRRRLLLGAGAAGMLAVVTGGLAATVAAIGRALHDGTAVAATTPTPSASPTRKATATATAPPAGRLIAHTAEVAEGSAVAFSEDDGAPALLVHETSGEFRAFTAVCTHSGCTVEYDGTSGFVCPCHGGRYDAQTGAVTAGPPPAPLRRIDVVVVDGDVRLG
jgi:thiosulfate dehydrogenase [quinone] large subunit